MILNRLLTIRVHWCPAVVNLSRLLLSALRFLRYPLFTAFLFMFSALVHAQSGMLDTNTFNSGDGVDLSVRSIAIQTNGQIVIAGDFFSFNDTNRINLARLNPGGSLDVSFDPNAALDGYNPYVYSVAVQSNGQILVGGSFTNSAATNFARLGTNGTLDATFTTVADDTVNAVVIQTNGSILIGGLFTHVNGRARTAIARVDSGGMLDLGFSPNISGGSSALYALALQGDGKILIGGSFTNLNVTARTNFARLNSDGTTDAGFKPVSVGGGQFSLPAFYALAIDAQGRVVVGGDFASVNSLARTNLARFNSDGSLDTNFSAGTDFPVTSIAAQSDGKILIGGYFNTVNGTAQNYIARLNSNGSLDADFNTGGTGASDVIYSIALQPDGKVLIGGAFTEYNSVTSYGIARLLNTVGGPPIFNPFFSNNVFGVSVSTIAGKSYVLQYKNALSDSMWSSLPAVAGDGTIKVLTDSSATVSRRFYRVQVQ